MPGTPPIPFSRAGHPGVEVSFGTAGGSAASGASSEAVSEPVMMEPWEMVCQSK
jgi:hypothetical protein